jgi:hypothetical protein
VGLNPSASAFFIFCALVICEGLAGQGLGVAISAATKDEKVAFALAPMVRRSASAAPAGSCQIRAERGAAA